MHLVTESYFDAFCRDFSAPFDESKNFEAFVNYCIFLSILEIVLRLMSWYMKARIQA